MTETIDTAQPEALRLASGLEEGCCSLRDWLKPAAAELRRLQNALEMAVSDAQRSWRELAAAEARNATLTDDAARWQAILAHVQELGPEDFMAPIDGVEAWVKTIDSLVAAMKEKTP